MSDTQVLGVLKEDRNGFHLFKVGCEKFDQDLGGGGGAKGFALVIFPLVSVPVINDRSPHRQRDSDGRMENEIL